jgi:AraC-like DNA-binding protein
MAVMPDTRRLTYGTDPSEPLDIGCGTMIPVRSSRFASMLDYTHDCAGAPARVDAKRFEFDVIILTTRGRWQFHGRAGRAEIDSSSLMVGVAEDGYGCRHDQRVGDSNLAVALRPGAIDPDLQPLFSKQIIPARGAFSLLKRAARTDDDELFESLVFALFDDASTTSWRLDGKHAPDVRMQRAKRFIELHAFERLRLADIARELGLSPFSTLRQFREASGKTPYTYLLELRLERAKTLLAGSRTPIRAVGGMVGFGDLSHFSRFFKAATGHSPSEYRALRSAGMRVPLLDPAEET